jgi:hypothetical protein
MDAITVLPSLARPLSVCVTKKAEELHTTTQQQQLARRQLISSN